MRFLKLILSSLILSVFFSAVCASSIARADSTSTKPRLALASDPAAPARPAVVDKPVQLADAAAPAQPESKRSAWWVWVVIAAGVVGVATLVVVSSGKDPSCPAGRVCQ